MKNDVTTCAVCMYDTDFISTIHTYLSTKCSSPTPFRVFLSCRKNAGDRWVNLALTLNEVVPNFVDVVVVLVFWILIWTVDPSTTVLNKGR